MNHRFVSLMILCFICVTWGCGIGQACRLDQKRGFTEGDSRYLPLEALDEDAQPQLDKIDMFALGISLYELISGVPLTQGTQGVKHTPNVLLLTAIYMYIYYPCLWRYLPKFSC